MNVAMMQPAFLPWQGYFELIYKTDIFVLLDDFQFSVQSYHQRNRLFVNQGQVDWYNVPVHKALSFKSPLNSTLINYNLPWQSKMWKRLQTNYSKAPFYSKISPLVEKWLFEPATSLAEFNIGFIGLACQVMGITRIFRRSSHFYSESHRSKRVLDILEWCKAGRYFCAKGSFGYMREDGVFPLDSVEVLFQDFRPNPYHQICAISSFEPSLSVLDSLFNVGPEETLNLIERGTRKWLSWDEMCNLPSIEAGSEKGK